MMGFSKEITRKEAYELVKDSVCSLLCCAETDLTMETDITSDLGADSLDKVSLMMEFEDKMGISAPENSVHGLRTIGQMGNPLFN